MRAEFARAIVDLHDGYPNLVFITGDLGYMALEGVNKAYGNRFVNAGVAEQNMVSLAAGMAYEGFLPWVYSIAPFAVIRPYEQIRNDVCLHNLPVKIVGNGGGYGYGIMGSTHHTLEDIGVMRVLPNMNVYVPLLASDVNEAVRMMAADPSPNYLRLNLGARIPGSVSPFAPWRQIARGTKGVIIGAGPVVGNLFDEPLKDLVAQFDVWSVGMFPLREIPRALVERIRETGKVISMEEHYGECGLNETLAARILGSIDRGIDFRSLYARGYPSGRYGSQRWHQEENGLAGASLESLLKEVIHA